MIKFTLLQFLLRGIPEMLIVVWGIYALSKEQLNIKDYIFTSLSLSIITYITRSLPIYFGLHTLINIFLIVLILTYKKLPLIKTIYSTLLVFIILCFSELINMIGLNILNISTNIREMSPGLKEIWGAPSLIFTVVLIAIIKNILGRSFFSFNN